MAKTDPSNVTMAAVGHALSTWSGIELQMCSLFQAVSDIPEKRKARAMFDGVISFEVRVAILDRVMSFEDTDPTETEMWARMSARLTKFYKKRHELAHFALLVPKDGAASISPFLTMARWTDGTPVRLTNSDIADRTEKFVRMFEALFWFIQRAKQRRGEPFEALGLRSIEERGLVAHLRDLATQNLARRELPPPPPAA
jgi:hypothetical protein